MRTANIFYDTIDEEVSSFVPLLFLDGDHFFLDGIEGGVKLLEGEKARLGLFGRLRFVDIPREFQNEIQADTVDLGARLRYQLSDSVEADLEFLSDDNSRTHGNLRIRYLYEGKMLNLWPYMNIRVTSSEFNSYYYGLDTEEVDSGTEFAFGLRARYHVYRNLYTIASLRSTWLGSEVTEVDFADRESVQEVYLGIAFFNEKHKKRKSRLSISPYFRLAHGWATPSNMGEIISGDTESDPYNNQLTSLFYGHPLTDELFGFPLGRYTSLPGLCGIGSRRRRSPYRSTSLPSRHTTHSPGRSGGGSELLKVYPMSLKFPMLRQVKWSERDMSQAT